MKELKAFDSRSDATVLAELLDDEDIPYVIQPIDATPIPNTKKFAAVKIMVSEANYGRAVKLIRD